MKGNIMADSSPLAGLLDRAGKVFSLAGKLGRAFHEEYQGRGPRIEPASRNQLAPTFKEFYIALADLREPIRNPPNGFRIVAEHLLQAAKLALEIRDRLVHDGGFTACLDFFPDLNTICRAGLEAVKQIAKARRLDDPLAFVDKPIAPAFSLLDRFPATPAGHVAFLEFVRDEVHYTADAKRNQLAEKYPNDTIERMVRGIKWAEARARLDALSSISEGVRANVGNVLNRELTAGTVDQIDQLLGPVVRSLRDAWECSRNPRLPTGNILEALVSVQGALEAWNSNNSPSETGYLVENVPAGHPLHTAVAELQLHYGGTLPRSAAVHWRKFLKLVRNDNEDAEDEVLWLLDWVSGTIQSLNNSINHVDVGTTGASAGRGEPAEERSRTSAPPKRKRSTERGEGQAKLIAALTKHHKYADGSCLNLEPIGNNELARLAEVSESTASAFFNKQFDGHTKYRAICADATRLVAALKLLNQEFAPHHLFGAKPPDEGEREDKE